MGRRRKSGKRGPAPDDYFASGPFELARFGRVLVGRMNASESQHAEMTARMAASYPEIVAKIDALVAAIAARVARLPAIRLLHRAWWEHSAVVLIGGNDPADQGAALRMIDYIQSIIVSVAPTPDDVEDVSEEEWQALKEDVSQLFYTLTLPYQMAASAHRKEHDSEHNMALEEFQVRAEMMWMNVRGQRYHLHERQALIDTIMPHSDVIERLFGINALSLIEQLDKILAKLTGGLQELFTHLEEVRERTLDRMVEISTTEAIDDFEILRNKVFEDEELRDASGRIAGGLLGYDLFDVERNTTLPRALLDALSYAPSEETEFFAPGPFAGWPLRVWPVMKRPFIRLDGRTYCFDMFALFDNFYRVLQRAIFRLAPDYKQTWNERQQAVSETLPFDYLKKLLPGGTTYRPIYYRWKVGNSPPQWHEADGLFLYDDHMFVVEVKAGAFTYTSPATDLPAHIASLRNLVLNPARQGARFVDYLESAEEVTIHDAEHREIGRLRRRDFRHIAICAITLDPFTELAARANHLGDVGIDIGDRPIWALSLDDLRAYADLFDDPLIFLHFAEQRMAAARSDLVELTDEFDHLGMYLVENDYARYAVEIRGKGNAKLNFNGYRTDIDAYFSSVLQGEAPQRPKQRMPERIAELVRVLSNGTKPGRSMLASFLLDAAGDHRETIARMIDEGLGDHLTLGRVRPFSTYGEHAFTLFTWSPLVPRNSTNALEFTRNVVAQAQENNRLLVEIDTDAIGAITDVSWSLVGLDGLSDTDVARHREAGRQLGRRRVELARARGKIGVNQQCPCGSGIKYKRCHGRR